MTVGEQKRANASGQAGDRPILAVIGLGNPILGDDGVGWRVAEQVARRLEAGDLPPPAGSRRQVRVECSAAGGLSLMERLIGCEHALLIDSIVTGARPPGTVMKLRLDDLPSYAKSYTASAHDATLKDALQMARRLGVQVPRGVDVVAIEISPAYTFSEELSEAVSRAVPIAEQLVLDFILEEVQDDLT